MTPNEMLDKLVTFDRGRQSETVFEETAYRVVCGILILAVKDHRTCCPCDFCRMYGIMTDTDRITVSG